ncbi:MAG: type II toxin-antitoxin system RelE/ParE family toxin [Candidatus Micrarchaeia archaeon]
MVKNIVFTNNFERSIRKLKDAALRERIKKKIAEIVERPETGKPLRFQRKGERSVKISPFRIIYALQGDTIYFLDFDKRNKVYR